MKIKLRMNNVREVMEFDFKEKKRFENKINIKFEIFKKDKHIEIDDLIEGIIVLLLEGHLIKSRKQINKITIIDNLVLDETTTEVLIKIKGD